MDAAERQDTAISLRRVSKSFDGQFAIEEMNLEVKRGETVVLVGPSGCGKTTTMRMINRLIEPTSGEIEVEGKNVMEQDPVELRRGIGYVIQSAGLMPHRTVGQNIATVPRLLGWDKGRVQERVLELAGMLGLDPELLDRYPRELSGGQQQRVGVARALAADPPIMLMDEPFAAVDPIVRRRLQDQFLEIQERLHKSIVFVTHDIDEAIRMADRVAIMNVGGKVEQFAPPEEVLKRPADEFVARFVGSERSLKRLGLLAVAEIKPDPGPRVEVGEPVGKALAEMERFATDWVSVTKGGKLLGWIGREDLGKEEGVGTRARPFLVKVTPKDSLRQALEAIVASRTQVAVITDRGGRYLGVITLEQITRELAG